MVAGSLLFDKKGDITMPVVLGLVLSAIVFVTLLNAACTIIDLAPSNDNNFQEVVDSINKFADPSVRGATISNQYPVKLSKKNIILGFSPSVDAAELDFAFYRDDGEHYLDKYLNIPKPSFCSDDSACLCFCDEYSIVDTDLTCEKYSCVNLDDTVYFEDFTYEGNLYDGTKQYPVKYEVDQKGGFTLTYYGLIGTFFKDIRYNVLPHDFYKLQWVSGKDSSAFCDDKNGLTEFNVCVD